MQHVLSASLKHVLPFNRNISCVNITHGINVSVRKVKLKITLKVLNVKIQCIELCTIKLSVISIKT